ncbi:hypothetical protein AB0L70_07595 [Kribbella sp. NPDC051952]|uniref:hypothetical protein n=1 Tax=Kribbella sp. NPDC051952 TaxID=3154851 RepID=UPI003417C755
MTAAPIRILLDTNVFIAAESDTEPRHPRAEDASELLRLTAQLGHSVCVASTIHDDFNRHADSAHRLRRRWQVERYHVLDAIRVPGDFRRRAGYPPNLGASAWVDMTLLLALERGAAQWLVTDDGGMHSHAATLGLSDQIFTLADALSVLRLQISQPIDIPAVEEVKGFQLDPNDPVFSTFDTSYDIKRWLKGKVGPEHRPCLVIQDDDGLQAIAILNEEREQSWGLATPSLKICTFKVAEAARGVKRGELLLWAIFQFARRRPYRTIFIEAFTHEETLTALLRAFGFNEIDGTTPRPGEKIFAKELVPPEDSSAASALEYQILYGPGNLRPERIFMVPIIPTWHASLFPMADEQPILAPGLTDHGNAMRKAYLCLSPSRQLQPGDTLLFYKTRVRQQVRAVGVVESTLITSDPVQILEYTGRRTVYTPREVSDMCSRGQVLAIRFRIDRVLDTPLTMNALIRHRVMARSPQSIMRIREGDGFQWLRTILAG